MARKGTPTTTAATFAAVGSSCTQAGIAWRIESMAGGGKGLGGRSNESEGNGGQNTSEKDRRCDLTRPLCCLRSPHPRAHRSTIARFNRTTSDRPKYLLPLPPVFDYPGARASPRSHRGTTNNEAAYPTAGKGRRHAWWCHGGHATNNVWCDAMQCNAKRCHDATMRRCDAAHRLPHTTPTDCIPFPPAKPAIQSVQAIHCARCTDIYASTKTTQQNTKKMRI